MNRLAFAKTRADVIRVDLEEIEADIRKCQKRMDWLLLMKQQLMVELNQLEPK